MSQRGREAEGRVGGRRQGALELVGPDRELARGLTAVVTPGHTPGHLSFLLASGGAQLFVTHDVDEAVLLGDRVVVLGAGEVDVRRDAILAAVRA